MNSKRDLIRIRRFVARGQTADERQSSLSRRPLAATIRYSATICCHSGEALVPLIFNSITSRRNSPGR